LPDAYPAPTSLPPDRERALEASADRRPDLLNDGRMSGCRALKDTRSRERTASLPRAWRWISGDWSWERRIMVMARESMG